jgi:hypothetical protein
MKIQASLKIRAWLLIVFGVFVLFVTVPEVALGLLFFGHHWWEMPPDVLIYISTGMVFVVAGVTILVKRRPPR